MNCPRNIASLPEHTANSGLSAAAGGKPLGCGVDTIRGARACNIDMHSPDARHIKG